MVTLRQFALTALLAISFSGCATPINSPGPHYGCTQPPTNTFSGASLDLKLASDSVAAVGRGQIDVSSKPAVLTTISQAAQDDQVRSYLRCLSMRRDGYDARQAVYLDRLLLFVQTKPTAQDFLAWQAGNPFPEGQN